MRYFTLSFVIHILAVASISSSIAGNSQQNYEVSFETTDSRKHMSAVQTKQKALTNTQAVQAPAEASLTNNSTSENKASTDTENSYGVISLNGQAGPTQSVFSYLVNQIYQNRIYPHESIRLKQQGQVTVKFYIDQDGEITDVQVATPCLHKLLNQAAIKTLDRIKINKNQPEIEKLFNRSYSFTFDFEITKAAS